MSTSKASLAFSTWRAAHKRASAAEFAFYRACLDFARGGGPCPPASMEQEVRVLRCDAEAAWTEAMTALEEVAGHAAKLAHSASLRPHLSSEKDCGLGGRDSVA